MDSQPRFTKAHEAVLFVLLPLLVTWVWEALVHPQVWILFVIGLIPLVALIHMFWPKTGTWDPCVRIVTVGIIILGYGWGGLAASRLQIKQRIKVEQNDVYQHLTSSYSIPTGGTIADTVFTVTNEGESTIGKHNMILSPNDTISFIGGGGVKNAGPGKYGFMDSRSALGTLLPGGGVVSVPLISPGIGLGDIDCADIIVKVIYFWF